MSAVQARVHYSLKQELKLLKKIIAEYTPEEYPYDPVEGDRYAKKSDYDNVDVIPVSDPNASTMAQKIVQYQAVMQLAQQSPGMFNMPLLYRQMMDVLGIKEAAKLVPLPEDQKPKDPVTENQDALMLKPMKAFAYQDHKAHIAVHSSAMQDPMIQQLLAQNPQAQVMQAAMQAHIAEHLGFQYRIEIEQRLGMALPPQTDESGETNPMDPALEAKLAPLLAQAAQQVLQQNQAQMAKQQAAQQAQDPMLQLQQREVAIKERAQQAKEHKDLADAMLKKKQLDIDALKAAASISTQKQDAERKDKIDAAKALADLDRTKQEAQHSKGEALLNAGLDILKEQHRPKSQPKPSKGE